MRKGGKKLVRQGNKLFKLLGKQNILPVSELFSTYFYYLCHINKKHVTMNSKNERIVFIDYIRVVACFLVMLVHASENFYGADVSGLAGNMSLLQNEQNRFWVAFWDGGVSRIAVPLFMIVSAFLLVPLRPGQTMTGFYRRRFWRIVPPFVCFLLLYTFLPLLWGGMTWEQSMHDLRMLPFNFPSMAGHLWFMYPLISLYLIIPVVSPWLQQASARDERVFLYIFLFSTLTPWLHRFVSPELWGECHALVLLRLSGLSRLGPLHPRASEVDGEPPSHHRCGVLPRGCRLHGLELLVEGRTRTTHRDTHAGVVVGVLHTQCGADHLRSLPLVQYD